MATTKTTTTPTRHWFDYDTGSAYLGISKRSLKQLVWDRKIGHTRLDNRALFSQEQLDQYVAACTVEPTK